MSEHFTVRDFAVGQRIEMHPATDLWMRGARFGSVAKVGQRYVHVLLDFQRPEARPTPVIPENIGRIL